MINSIPKIESNDVNKFGQVTTKNLPSNYWLPAKDTVEVSKPQESEPVKEEDKKSKIKILTPDEARKTNDIRLIGLSIAGATVLAAATIFTFLRGGPKGVYKSFAKMRDYFERQLLKSKLENGGEMTFTNKVYVYLIKSIDTASKKFESINNFTTFKDLLFKKMMGFNKYFAKVHDKITQLFERIGRQSVKNSYSSTAGNLMEVRLLQKNIVSSLLKGKVYDLVDINGVKLSRAEWISKIDILSADLLKIYKDTFSEKPLGNRYLRFKRAADDLKKSFNSLRKFWSKDFFNTFMAESEIVKEKEAVQKLVRNSRRQISYSRADMYQDADDLIMKMTGVISFKDANRIRQLQIIKADIRSFASSGNQDIVLKHKILNNINAFTSDLKSAIQYNQIDKKVGDELLANITDLNNIVGNYRAGKVEDILQIYKAILPKDDYLKVKKLYRNVVKSLDKSIRLETEEFVCKLRDLVLGSAPTDVLTMLGAVGLLGYQVGKSENNDERLSITLKYGIPALLGQVGVTLYCNAKLFAGTKSLIIGTLSGLLLNRIGEFTDNKVKEFRKKKQVTQNPQVMAQSEINQSVKNPTKTV